MTKRTTITLSDRVYSDLQKWAQQEGRPVANLAAFLIEVMVNERVENGQ